MILYEHRLATKRTGPVRLVSKEDLDELCGFRSVYGFTGKAIEHIQSTNSTAGLQGFELYSDVLLVDFDNQPRAAYEFEMYLDSTVYQQTIEDSNTFKLTAISNGYSYEKYDSGGRSTHFHVPIQPMIGTTIPESQKEFMKRIAPLADMSVYKTSGMFRLPGTFHHKNPGKYKKLLHKQEGSLLEIPIINSTESKTSLIPRMELEDIDLEYILMRLLVTKVVEGTVGRNNHVFKIAAVCRDLGIPLNECEYYILEWNMEYCKPPLVGMSVRSAINSAYKRKA